MSSTSELSLSTNTSSEESDRECFQDSITKRRRHAVYLHRPPVWYPGPCSHDDSPGNTESHGIPYAYDIRDLQENCQHLDVLEGPLPVCQECHKDLGTDKELGIFSTIPDFSLEDERWKLRAASWLQEPVSEATAPSDDNVIPAVGQNSPPLYQRHAGLCTRLRSCRDVRVGSDENWAIKEGSLVVCIDPEYTILRDQKRSNDEFELVYGDFYVICQLYADFWALCTKVSLNDSPKSDWYGAERDDLDRSFLRLGFLPLCAVTLAANFSAFIDRCTRDRNCLYLTKYPGNGLPVAPPERSHSLRVDKKSLEETYKNTGVPATLCDSLGPEPLLGVSDDFVPLDSTIRSLFADRRFGRDETSALRRQLSLKKFWQNLRNPEATTDYGSSAGWSSASHSRNPSSESDKPATQPCQGPRRTRGSFAAASENLKRLIRMSAG
ncbi:hypothetical protein ASPZODRAFT_134711 [Penicilliopsis zonata CBS 506.65]|uniref:Uncharacterized protein n=1 Tax=Penicilliopsis zonata CBS 506.65 TaxID=1073090 RepID=A0A1L9SBQ0_9EURO|nr:hypothetical protein ASPZODRAFT_134711 [Penicilliopsis zonata CBS 506.65]OJJ44630.1 hypothetical protein ASPZODRAFT_134711 [Penicilliopsis zonata CBS 506.65]